MKFRQAAPPIANWVAITCFRLEGDHTLSLKVSTAFIKCATAIAMQYCIRFFRALHNAVASSAFSTFSPTPRLFSDILNSEKKFPPPPQSSQSKVSKSSAVSKISATKEVAASTTTTTKQLENQRRRHREVMSSAWRPKEEKKADEHQVPNSERFYVSMKIPNYVHEYEGCISKGKQHEKVTVSLAGKIAHKIQRYNSSNLFFYDLEGGGSKVQIVAEARNSELAESEFCRLHPCVMPGDLVGVVGFPVRVEFNMCTYRFVFSLPIRPYRISNFLDWKSVQFEHETSFTRAYFSSFWVAYDMSTYILMHESIFSASGCAAHPAISPSISPRPANPAISPYNFR
ncbi:hypothetical protein ACLB2K_028091 [Fragaria x ananassa]